MSYAWDDELPAPVSRKSTDPSDLARIGAYIRFRRGGEAKDPLSGIESAVPGSMEGGAGDLLDHLIVTPDGAGLWPMLTTPGYAHNVMFDIALDMIARRKAGQEINLEGWSPAECEQLAHGARKGMTLGQLEAAERAFKRNAAAATA